MIRHCLRCSEPTTLHPWRGIILCSVCLTVVAADYARYRRMIGRYLGFSDVGDADSTETSEVTP